MTKQNVNSAAKSQSTSTKQAKKEKSGTMSLAKSAHTMVQPVSELSSGGRAQTRLLCFW